MADDWQDIPENDGLTLGPEDALEREIARSKALKVERLQLRDRVNKLEGEVRALTTENDRLKTEGGHGLPRNQETAPPELHSGEDLAVHGEKVRNRLAAWFATAPAETYGETAETYYGRCTVHELLERTTWHAAQHTRQVYHVLEEAKILPPGGLDPAVTEGLPLPKEMW